MHPYGFALAPLLLYSLLDASSTHLKQWLRMCPRNQITVLDTHDGICIPDVEGVLPNDEIKHVSDNVSARSAEPILRRQEANVHSVGAIYQQLGSAAGREGDGHNVSIYGVACRLKKKY